MLRAGEIIGNGAFTGVIFFKRYTNHSVFFELGYCAQVAPVLFTKPPALGIIMGLVLQTVIIVFGRWRYMPVLFVFFALIFILVEILWLERYRLHV
jgi:hypothetical protein